MGRGSLGAQQGMRAATATQAEEAALRNHPETTTRKQPPTLPTTS